MAIKYYQMTADAAPLAAGANDDGKWKFRTRFTHPSMGINCAPNNCPTFSIDPADIVCTADERVQHQLEFYKVPNSPFHPGWDAVEHVFEEVGSDPGAIDLDQLISEHVNG